MNLYRKFAAFLASRGWAGLIYDLRGTGESAKPGDKSNREIRMSDWIVKDVPAATRALKQRFPHAKHVAVGHSVGAHGMLATQHEESVEAMVMVASHAGITRTILTAAERAKVWMIFNVVTPVCAKLMGYVPVEKLGVGKTIPLGVMLQGMTFGRTGVRWMCSQIGWIVRMFRNRTLKLGMGPRTGRSDTWGFTARSVGFCGRGLPSGWSRRSRSCVAGHGNLVVVRGAG